MPYAANFQLKSTASGNAKTFRAINSTLQGIRSKIWRGKQKAASLDQTPLSQNGQSLTVVEWLYNNKNDRSPKSVKLETAIENLKPATRTILFLTGSMVFRQMFMGRFFCWPNHSLVFVHYPCWLLWRIGYTSWQRFLAVVCCPAFLSLGSSHAWLSFHSPSVAGLLLGLSLPQTLLGYFRLANSPTIAKPTNAHAGPQDCASLDRGTANLNRRWTLRKLMILIPIESNYIILLLPETSHHCFIVTLMNLGQTGRQAKPNQILGNNIQSQTSCQTATTLWASEDSAA